MREVPEIPQKLLAFMSALQMKTSGGIPFEWDEHLFMIDPLTDWHPYQGINKCAQVGFSEMMICKAIYAAHIAGLNVIYTLQSAEAMDDFVKGKFDAIVRANPYLQRIVSGNTSIKTIKFEQYERLIHLVGAYNSEASGNQGKTGKGISKTADIRIHDEASRSSDSVIDQMASRTLNSKYDFAWLFDNPWRPNMGADKIYKKSDQRHWIIRCNHCNAPQYLSWHKLSEYVIEPGEMHCYIDDTNKKLVCRKCKKFIEDESRRTGEWVAKVPSIKDYRGYWINQLMYVHHSIPSLLKRESEMSSETFANMVMGMPYLGSTTGVSREIISKNIISRAEQPTYSQVAMGVDQGNEKQWVLMDKYGMFDHGRTRSWDDIMMIRDKYDAYIVMDAEPEDVPINICKKYPGRAWRAYFKNETYMNELYEFGDKPHNRDMVYIKRNMAFDDLSHKINNIEFPINENINDLSDYCAEWEALVRVTQEDSNGNMKPDWVKTLANVDFPFATLYAYIASKKMRKGSAVNIEPVRAQPKGVQQGHKSTKELIAEMTKNIKR